MKQGKIYNKITIAVLLLCVLLYLAYAIISAIGQPLTTTLAVEYEAGEGSNVTGYVVREETVLTSPYDITVLERQEGEKVGVGQTVAVGYLTTDAQERQSEIDNLTAQLEQFSLPSDTSRQLEELFYDRYLQWSTDAFALGLHLGLSLFRDNVRRGGSQQV